jgi:hypothetical protein
MSGFRDGDEFAALMVSLGRIGRVNQLAFEAAQSSERTPQRIEDRRRLERENKYLLCQLRSSLLCSAYSLTEAAIKGLTSGMSAPEKLIKEEYRLSGKIPALYRSQYRLQKTSGICWGEEWDEDWSRIHRLRNLRNALIHDGAVGEEAKLASAIDRDDGFGAWVEPMFEGSDASIYVLVVGEMHFRQWMQRLQDIVWRIDAELSGLEKER